MADLATGWLGLFIIVGVAVLVLLAGVQRERVVSAQGSLKPAGTAQSLLWLLIGFGVVATVIAVLVRFDAGL